MSRVRSKTQTRLCSLLLFVAAEACSSNEPSATDAVIEEEEESEGLDDAEPSDGSQQPDARVPARDAGPTLRDAAQKPKDAAQSDAEIEPELDAGSSPAMEEAGMVRPRDAQVIPNDTGAPTTWPMLTADQLGAPTRLSDSFRLAEGPLWDHCKGHMLFTDVEASAVHAIADDGAISVARPDTNYANGLAFDHEGRLHMAEMGGGRGGRISRVEHDGKLTVLADMRPRGGTLNTSDDLVIRSDGTIYFSDPVIPHGPSLAFSLGSGPLYRIGPNGGAPTEVATAVLPNGVELSPDEKTLYLSAFLGGEVLSFNVGADGALSGRRVFLPGLSNPDSMCLDAAGNVYVGVTQGLAVARPDGTPVKLIEMNTSQGVTNCGFGGPEGKTLYITAWNTLWRIDNLPIPGLDWIIDQRNSCPP